MYQNATLACVARLPDNSRLLQMWSRSFAQKLQHGPDVQLYFGNIDNAASGSSCDGRNPKPSRIDEGTIAEPTWHWSALTLDDVADLCELGPREEVAGKSVVNAYAFQLISVVQWLASTRKGAQTLCTSRWIALLLTLLRSAPTQVQRSILRTF